MRFSVSIWLSSGIVGSVIDVANSIGIAIARQTLVATTTTIIIAMTTQLLLTLLLLRMLLLRIVNNVGWCWC